MVVCSDFLEEAHRSRSHLRRRGPYVVRADGCTHRSRSQGGRTIRVAVLLVAAVASSGVGVRAQEATSLREQVVAGRTALADGNVEAAVVAFEEAARLAPADAEIAFMLGTALERAGREGEAVDSFRRAISLDPAHSEARLALERLGSIGWRPTEVLERAASRADEGRFKEAAYLYRRYLEDHPGDAGAVLGLARCSEGLGELDDALELYRRALALDPTLSQARAKIDQLAPPTPTPRPQRTRVSSGATESRAAAAARPTVKPTPAAERPVAATSERPRGDAATVVAASTAGDAAPAPPAPTVPTRAAASSPAVEMVTPAPVQDLRDANDSESATPTPRGPPKLGAAAVVGLAAVVVAAVVVAAVVLRRSRRRCTIKGDLEQFALADVLQMLCQGNREGTLEVKANGLTGRIDLLEGQMVRSELGSERGETALFSLLALESGSFRFQESTRPQTVKRNLNLNLTQALLRWACLTDEANRSPDGGDADPFDTLVDTSHDTEIVS